MLSINAVRRIRRSLRGKVVTVPELYLPIKRFLGSGFGVVSRHSELVIEGYPRSGNSFSEAAFRIAQTRDVRIAHHSHAAAQIIAGARWKVPTLVVIRHPVDAGRSLVMHDPDIFTPKRALQEYCQFHEAIEPYRSSFVLASFETVVSDFGKVVDVINDRFGTEFMRFEHTEENEKAAFALLDRTSRERGTVGEDGEPYSPSRSRAAKQDRQLLKERTRDQFMAKELERLRGLSEGIYLRLVNGSDV